MKKLQQYIDTLLDNFWLGVALAGFIGICLGVATSLLEPNEAHANTGQDYQQGQLMQRLVKAEEDQARALQHLVRVMERK